MKNILEIALYAGQIMLENGAETYRVEDTINRICLSRGLKVENFTIPTGIFLSCIYNDDYYPYVIRTKTMKIDLEIITEINDFSRNFSNGDINIDIAKEKLEKIKNSPEFSSLINSFFGGIAGSFFTLSFGGTQIEAVLSFITSFIVVTCVKKLSKTMGSFVKNALGGMINTIVALMLLYVFKQFYSGIQLSNIVIGSLMPLVPGVAMTNALRDTISGDFVSGVSKLAEAIMVAIAIAMGVGLILHFKMLLTGSI